MAKKTYVLDTNILMQSPNAIFGFADNEVVITGTTLQELDRHKGDIGDNGYNTREAVRILDNLRQQGDLKKGVKVGKGKVLLVRDIKSEDMPDGYSLDVPDNRIISTVLAMAKVQKTPVILITNDISMRINATICGISAQGYKNETIEDKEDYTGKMEIKLSPEEIDTLFLEKRLVAPEYIRFEENIFVHITSNDPGSLRTAMAIYQKGTLNLIADKERGFNGIVGKNITQRMLMHALLAPAEEIPLVVVKGPAGTGKTLLAIACALERTYSGQRKKDRKEYDQVLITRANVISDNDLGALPGTLEEKMDPLIAPFLDNMKSIFAGNGDEKDLDVAKQQIDYVLGNEIVKICAVGYLRGRSIENSYLIVDEAQNLTVHQALEIVTRAAEGTKVVLLGDPDQIDARYLDKHNNGLVFTADRMKGSTTCAQIEFHKEESIRSKLACEAAKRMSLKQQVSEGKNS